MSSSGGRITALDKNKLKSRLIPQASLDPSKLVALIATRKRVSLPPDGTVLLPIHGAARALQEVLRALTGTYAPAMLWTRWDPTHWQVWTPHLQLGRRLHLPGRLKIRPPDSPGYPRNLRGIFPRPLPYHVGPTPVGRALSMGVKSGRQSELFWLRMVGAVG